MEHLGGGHGVQSEPRTFQNRVLYADPKLAELLAEARPGTETHSDRVCILYDSESGKASGYYAEDRRAAVREYVAVVRVVVSEWTELQIRPHASDAIDAVLDLINTPRSKWAGASRLARDLLTMTASDVVAISVPVGHGRAIWVPEIERLRGRVEIGPSHPVLMRWSSPPVEADV